MAEKIKVAVIFGPTASGKTRLAATLARRHNGEVVSADSMQIYRGMEIGTAKPTEQEMLGIPHHLLGFLSPDRPFSVAEYVAMARDCIAEIAARGRLPVLAGGTGLYLRALLQNLSFSIEEADPALREALQKRAQEEGPEALFQELRQVDPETASRLHPNDLKRVIRALELYRKTGRTMAEQNRQSRAAPSLYQAGKIGLAYTDRALLYRRIDRRVDEMFARGLLEEARVLLSGDCGPTAVQAIGYKELVPYFSGAVSLEEAKENIKRETRRYAKRQMTWLRREEGLHWLAVDQYERFEALVEAAEAVLCEEGIVDGDKNTEGAGVDE